MSHHRINIPCDMKDALAQTGVATNTHARLAVLIHLTEETRLHAPLGRGEMIQGDSAQNTRLDVLYPGCVQTANHVHPPLEWELGMENGDGVSWLPYTIPSVYCLLEQSTNIRTQLTHLQGDTVVLKSGAVNYTHPH